MRDEGRAVFPGIKVWDIDVCWFEECLTRLEHDCLLTVHLEKHRSTEDHAEHRARVKVKAAALVRCECDALDLNTLDRRRVCEYRRQEWSTDNRVMLCIHIANV